MLELDKMQPNAFISNELISTLYILERDSKNLYMFDLQAKSLTKKIVDMPSNFPHNYQYVQTRQNRLFLIGGGDFSQIPESMFRTSEIDLASFKLIPKQRMTYARHGHSACELGEKFIIVTGSRKEQDKAQHKCEQYNIDLDLWFELPELNEGRHYHASAQFNQKTVYVFAGISNTTKKYVNSIEKYDNTTKAPWEMLTFS